MYVEGSEFIHECPYCKAQCAFRQLKIYEPDGVDLQGRPGVKQKEHVPCNKDDRFHVPYECPSCYGVIIIKWELERLQKRYHSSIPPAGGFKHKVDLEKITSSEAVKKDFLEAIECYNNLLYNASMVMSRRTMEREVIYKEGKGQNLYEKIESLGISTNLKTLLQKVKNFGNHGAHPGYLLYDKDEKPIENKKEFAELALEFLDRYFQDQESAFLADKAPKSEKERSNE